MNQDTSGNSAVELRDGSTGNFKVAQQYFRDLLRYSSEQPENFRRLCASIFANPHQPLTEEHKLSLIDAGLAWRHAGKDGIALRRPEAEIVSFVQLAVTEDKVSRIFTLFSVSAPVSYKVVSPFMHPEFGCPDEVAPKDRTALPPDVAGLDTLSLPAEWDCRRARSSLYADKPIIVF